MPLIEPGKKAPAFTLTDHTGQPRRLKDHAKQHVVLFFYPKPDSPSCTEEACSFEAELKAFERAGAVVMGLSTATPAQLAKFAKKAKLSLPLLADEPDSGGTPGVADAYGVWVEKSMYGKTYMGISRTTYLIAPGGKVLRRWDRVKTKGHADEVLAALKEVS